MFLSKSQNVYSLISNVSYKITSDDHNEIRYLLTIVIYNIVIIKRHFPAKMFRNNRINSLNAYIQFRTFVLVHLKVVRYFRWLSEQQTTLPRPSSSGRYFKY